ncbi:hypothetical protein ACHAWF_017963 [Thalassiosira exigua]
MPRIHGADADARALPRGIFSLSTPFRSSIRSPPGSVGRPPRGVGVGVGGSGSGGGGGGGGGGAGLDDSFDDGAFEFRGTQTQRDFDERAPPSAAAARAAVASEDRADRAAVAVDSVAPGGGTREAASVGGGERGVSPPPRDSTGCDSHPRSRRISRTSRSRSDRTDRFEDGMDGGDDSDATTMDGSVDLLAEGNDGGRGGYRDDGDGAGNDANDRKAASNDDNGASDGGSEAIENDEGGKPRSVASSRRPPMPMLSPVSPATQTLDRLSQLGSQEGGAELRMNLLADAAASAPKAATAEGPESQEEDKGGKDSKGEEGGGSEAAREKAREGGPADEGRGKGGRDAVAEEAPRLELEAKDKRRRGRAWDRAPATRDSAVGTHGRGKRERLREFKEYFMSTRNSAKCARSKTPDFEPPSAPFCRRCRMDSHPPLTQLSQNSMSLPHHGLCPLHPDFYDSGSYEILNLVVDGNLLGCRACAKQFDAGRPDKTLSHENGCKRAQNAGGTKRAKDDPTKAKREKDAGDEGRAKGSARATRRRDASPTPSSSQASLPSLAAGTSTRPRTSGAGQRTPPPACGAGGVARGGGGSGSGSANIGDGAGPPYAVGSLVLVADRQWAKMNDPGGVARVLAVRANPVATEKTAVGAGEDDDGSDNEEPSPRVYDVGYVVPMGPTRARDVEERYISPHVDYISPTKGEDLEVAQEEEVEDEEVDEDEEEEEETEQGNEKGPSDEDEDVDEDEGEYGDDNEAEGQRQDVGEDNGSEVDEDGRPLSEYERARRRNIKRNEARLAQLGLLNQSRPKPGGKKRQRKRRGARLEMERRVQPRRHGSCPDETVERADENVKPGEGNNGKPEKPVSGSSGKVPTVSDGAQSGCHKCIAELRTCEKTKRHHCLSCPLSKLHKKTEEGSSEASGEARYGNNSDNSNGGGQTTSRREWTWDEDELVKKLQSQWGNRWKAIAQEVGGGRTCDDVRNRWNYKLKRKAEQRRAVGLPEEEYGDDEHGGHDDDRYEEKGDDLANAAKAGCRKCTREWQMDKEDPTTKHDGFCPRLRKKATPEEPQFTPQGPSRGGQQVDSAPARTSLGSNSHGKAPANTSKASKAVRPRVRHLTPSPATARSEKWKDKKLPARPHAPPPPLPSWIQEFVSEADRQLEEAVPAPRGSRWVPCPNPWGKVGHEEGDLVIVSPFQSVTGADILGLLHRGPDGGIPQRFAANPLEDGSPYHATHRSPARGGYSVLRMTRDPMGLRPWGFTTRLHEFGGACLVDSVEPMSSAEAAEDISGWSGGGSPSGLKQHDMIICINGKSVGNMTMPEFQIDLDVCGPELMMVVARFDVLKSVTAGVGDCVTMEDLAMDWNDIGACDAPLKRKRVSFENEPCPNDGLGEEGQSHYLHGYESEDESDANDESSKEGESVSDDADCRETNNAPKLPSDFAAKPSKIVCAQETTVPSKAPIAKQEIRRPHKVPLSKAAESGCRKCLHELRTGSNDIHHHDSNCPRKRLRLKQGSGKHGSRNDRPNYPNKNDWSETQRLDTRPLDKKDCPNPKARETKGDPMSLKRRTCEVDSSNSQVKEAKSVPKTVEPSPKLKCGPRVSSWYQKQLEELIEDESDVLSTSTEPDKSATTTSRLHSKLTLGLTSTASAANVSSSITKKKAKSSDVRVMGDDLSTSSAEQENDGAGGDENPWLGCVCGKTHPHPIEVFWIQCEGCDAWYNVAQECVGFDEKAAEGLEEWFCWACDPPVAGLGL